MTAGPLYTLNPKLTVRNNLAKFGVKGSILRWCAYVIQPALQANGACSCYTGAIT